ncbi:integrase catalytic domain-containing protein [Trichonephila clavipes]|nr:integrase catalytic domain-containing protein [Trichonephila clavipes]
MQEHLIFRAYGACSKNDYAKREAYYLPHHAVLRDSSTTKLRLSSMHQPNQHQGILLMTYPWLDRVQGDVYQFCFSFRTFQIAVCADLEKMFRQKDLSKDTNWQRILWRDNPERDGEGI